MTVWMVSLYQLLSQLRPVLVPARDMDDRPARVSRAAGVMFEEA